MSEGNNPNLNPLDVPTQQPLPNATAVLVLGIISIPTCFCWGVPGLICAIIALVLAGKASTLYKANPNIYTPSSFSNMNGGRICAIIGLVLSVLAFLYFIFVFLFYGMLATSIFDILDGAR